MDNNALDAITNHDRDTLGCGAAVCVSSTCMYFCSRSCKRAAVERGIIIDSRDIDHDESALKLTDEFHVAIYARV